MRGSACLPERNLDSVSSLCSLRTSEVWAITSADSHTLTHTRIRNTITTYKHTHTHTHTHTSRVRAAHWASILSADQHEVRRWTHKQTGGNRRATLLGPLYLKWIEEGGSSRTACHQTMCQLHHSVRVPTQHNYSEQSLNHHIRLGVHR